MKKLIKYSLTLGIIYLLISFSVFFMYEFKCVAGFARESQTRQIFKSEPNMPNPTKEVLMNILKEEQTNRVHACLMTYRIDEYIPEFITEFIRN